MDKKKVIIVVGTRPEAVKLVPVYLQMQKHNELFDVKLCLTGQHKTMVGQILEFFQMEADIDLDLMEGNQTLNGLTSKVVVEMGKLLESEKPQLLMVQGDTTTAFVGALAAFYAKVPVAHVEAGLRTNDIFSPYPEEANRKFISCIASLNFAPTTENEQNLLNEGVSKDKVMVTGNTVIDALKASSDMIDTNADLTEKLKSEIGEEGYVIGDRKIVLITGHRRESFGQAFENICMAIADLAEKYPELDFVYPVHLNPYVREVVNNRLSGIDNVHLIDPLSYDRFVLMMKNAYIILTDSGGIQEEAPSLGKPVFVMRETTERTEVVAAGLVKVLGTERAGIRDGIIESINSSFADFNLGAINPYGDGKAADKIVDQLTTYFRKNDDQ